MRALVIAAVLSASVSWADAAHCAVPGMKDVLVAGAGLYVGGEQDAEQLAKLKKTFNVKHVIDLRPADVSGAVPEAKLAKKAGQKYVRIAVSGADDLTLENAKKLDAAMKAAKGEPVLVHCTSGNRAAALLALRDGLVLGQSNETALAFMKRSGLTKLESTVVERLAK